MSGSRRLLHLESDVAWRPEAVFDRAAADADGPPRAPDVSRQVRHFERRASETGVGSSARAVMLCEWAGADRMADDEMLSRLLRACRASNADDTSNTDVAQSARESGPPEPTSIPPLRPTLYRELGDDPDSRRRPTGPAILHVRVEVDPRYEARFLEWYVGVHVPAILDAPGMLSARRFERIPLAELGGSFNTVGEAGVFEGLGTFARRHYFTVYEMEGVDVVGREATQRCSERGACPADLEAHRVASNQIYVETARFGPLGA